MKGRIISNWNKMNLSNPTHLKQLEGAFQFFMRQPHDPKYSAALRTGAMQAFAYKGDFPAEILQVIEKFHQMEPFDLGYEQIFDIRDYTGTNESGFDILDVTSGLTFAKVPPGDKAKVFKFSGAKTSVGFDTYGGALGWRQELIDDKQYWDLEDNAAAFRNEAFRSRAQVFYDLIDATPSTYDLTWQSATGASLPNTDRDYQPIRDINTINKACENILLAIDGLGMGATVASRFVILAPIQLMGRLNRALGMVQQPFAGSRQFLTYNVGQPIYTTMLDSSTEYYVCFPKAKAKAGYRMQLTLYNLFDILEFCHTVAGWMRYGGAIAETKQFVRCDTSES